jgi:hypothetical protein
MSDGLIEVISPLQPIDVRIAREAGGAASPRPAVLDALRAKLGWRWKAGDAQGFLPALGAAYVVEEVRGTRVLTHRPNGYAIRTDVLGVTGAQLILLERLRPVIANARTVIQTLEPLRVAYDPQILEMRRSNLDAELENLLEQAESSDRFDVGLFDTFFISLFADDLSPWDDFVSYFKVDSRAPAGLLYGFEREGGFELAEAADQAEEETVLRWQGVVNDLLGAYIEYVSYRENLVPGSATPFLGPRFADVERELAVMQQTLEEFQSLMNAYLFGDADWDAQLIDVDGVPVPFKRFLTWADAFPAEASARLRDGGIPGALSLRLALERNTTVFAAAEPGKAVGFPETYNDSALIRSAHGKLLGSMTQLGELLESFEGWQRHHEEQRAVGLGEARRIAADEKQELAEIIEAMDLRNAADQERLRETLRGLHERDADLVAAVEKLTAAYAEAEHRDEERVAGGLTCDVKHLAGGPLWITVGGSGLGDDVDPDRVQVGIQKGQKRPTHGRGTRITEGVVEAIFDAPKEAGAWQVFLVVDGERRDVPEPLEFSAPWA